VRVATVAPLCQRADGESPAARCAHARPREAERVTFVIVLENITTSNEWSVKIRRGAEGCAPRAQGMRVRHYAAKRCTRHAVFNYPDVCRATETVRVRASARYCESCLRQREAAAKRLKRFRGVVYEVSVTRWAGAVGEESAGAGEKRTTPCGSARREVLGVRRAVLRVIAWQPLRYGRCNGVTPGAKWHLNQPAAFQNNQFMLARLTGTNAAKWKVPAYVR